jgi:hypothetical protein
LDPGDFAVHVRFALLSLAFCLLTATSFGIDDQPLRINAEDARQHAGKKVEVIFEVKATKNSAKRKTVFLDSEADFNDKKKILALQFRKKGLRTLRKCGMSPPRKNTIEEKRSALLARS